jgi:hypothetical protein
MPILCRPGCLSRISDPNGFFSIPYPGSRIQQQQKRGGRKKIVVFPFFVAINFTELKIITFFNSFKKNRSQLTNIVNKLSEILVGDPGSRKNLSWIPALDPGVKKAADPESSPATLKCCKYLRKVFHSKRGRRVGPGRIMVKILFISSAENPQWMQNNDSGEGGDKTILQSINMVQCLFTSKVCYGYNILT